MARAVSQFFTLPQLAQLYSFPASLGSAGQPIALIELDGSLRPQDLKSYFTGPKLPVPTVKVMSVSGARN